MYIFFEVIKGVFFVLTTIIALFFLRGEIMFGKEMFELIKMFLMPGYLVFCGLMLGYLTAHIWSANSEEETTQPSNAIAIRSFIIGIGAGFILALVYIFTS